MPTPEQAQTSAMLPSQAGLRSPPPSPSAPIAPSAPIGPPEPLLLPVPPRYHLGHALRYSGLAGLPPLVCGPDEAVPTLQIVLYPAAAGFRGPAAPAAVEVLVVQPSPLSEQPLLVYGLRPSPLADALLEQLRLMLRLDDDLGVFYRLTDQDPELAWVAGCDGGRLLRAPTAFEDLVHCLALAHGTPAQVAGLVQRLCNKLGPRTTLGRRGFPGPAAIAAAPLRVYQQLIAPWPGGTVTGKAGRGLGRALRELSILCASGSLHPESLRRQPGELTRALDLDNCQDNELNNGPDNGPDNGAGLASGPDNSPDDSIWQDALHEELEWQERVRSLLESLPGYRSPTVGSRAVEQMLLRLGCYDGLRLDPPARAAWERRFAPRRSRPARPAAAAPSAQTPAEQRAARHAHGLLVARRIARRLSPFSIYRGLAQALLLRVPPPPKEPRQ